MKLSAFLLIFINLFFYSSTLAADCKPSVLNNFNSSSFQQSCQKYIKTSEHSLEEHLYFEYAIEKRRQNLDCLIKGIDQVVQAPDMRQKIADDVVRKLSLIEEIKKRKLALRQQINKLFPSTQAKQIKELEVKYQNLNAAIEMTAQSVFMGQSQEVKSFILYYDAKKNRPEEIFNRIERIYGDLKKQKYYYEPKALTKNKNGASAVETLSDEAKASLATDLGIRTSFADQVQDKGNVQFAENVICKIDENYGFKKAQQDQWKDFGISVASIATPFAVTNLLRLGSWGYKTQKYMGIFGSLGSAALLAPGTYNSLARACTPLSRDIQNISCTKDPTKFLVSNLNQSNCYLEATLAFVDVGLAALPGAQFLRQSAADKAKISYDNPLTYLRSTDGVKVGSLPKDPQVKIWSLLKQGKTSEANQLKDQLYVAMKDGQVLKAESIGTGKTGAKWMTLDNGVVGVWKPYTGDFASGGSEVAVSLIDQHLGLNRVPLTIPKEYRGKRGTLQVKIEDAQTNGNAEFDPDRLNFLDYLIGNKDRHSDNYIVNKTGEVAAIDNGLAFKGKPFLLREIIYMQEVELKNSVQFRDKLKRKLGRLTEQTAEEQSRLSGELQKELRNYRYFDDKSKAGKARLLNTITSFVGDKAVVEKLRSTSEKDWKNLLGDKLRPDEISGMMARQQQIIKFIDQLEKKYGKDIYEVGPTSSVLSKPNRKLQTVPKKFLDQY